MKVAIAGAGAVGRSIARELVENAHDVTLVERNTDHFDIDAIPAAHWRLGDACELSLLEAVHLEEFDVVIAATGDDKANVVLSLLAKTEFAVPRVVARQPAWALTAVRLLREDATTGEPAPQAYYDPRYYAAQVVDPDGLPVGVQLIGPHFGEAKLLNAAHRYQQETDWHLRAPAGYATGFEPGAK